MFLIISIVLLAAGVFFLYGYGTTRGDEPLLFFIGCMLLLVALVPPYVHGVGELTKPDDLNESSVYQVLAIGRATNETKADGAYWVAIVQDPKGEVLALGIKNSEVIPRNFTVREIGDKYIFEPYPPPSLATPQIEVTPGRN